MAVLTEVQTQLLTQLERFFNPSELEQLARESRFIQRSTSRLSGESFLLLNILQDWNGSESSFQNLGNWLEDNYEFSISKQGLWERYNTYAVSFMRRCFERCLATLGQGTNVSLLSSFFSSINLSDSTSFKIPDKLCAFYPGASCVSGVKLMYDYDLLSGRFNDLWLGCTKDNDYIFLDRLEQNITPNSLSIKDLGFYKNEHFIAISKKGAYFLSRCKVLSTFHKYNAKGKWEAISMETIVSGVETLSSFDVYLGKGQEKIAIRLIVAPVPDEIWEKRNAKSSQVAKNNKVKVNPRTLQLNRYSFWITNIPVEVLPNEMVQEVYFLRWQIELVFKTWKSLLQIDEVSQMNIFRFECYIYAKLIQVLLSKSFENAAQDVISLEEEEEEEISNWKVAKIF
jgi:hypothetical protein